MNNDKPNSWQCGAGLIGDNTINFCEDYRFGSEL